MNSNILRYRGYYTKIEYSAESKVLYGKIEGINDEITLESYSAEKIVEEFHTAVDDYIHICTALGEEPEKAYSGMFNVRINPELHKRMATSAIKHGITLNKSVSFAIEEYLANDDY